MGVAIALLAFTNISPALQAQAPNFLDAVGATFEEGSGNVTIDIPRLDPTRRGVVDRSILLFRPDSSYVPELRFTVDVPANAANVRITVDAGADVASRIDYAFPLREMEGSDRRRTPQIVSHTRTRDGGAVSIGYAPYRLSGETISYPASARLTVTWEAGSTLGSPTDAKGFATAAAQSGWGVERPSIVLLTPTTGIYSIDGARLMAQGLPGGTSIASLRLANRSTPRILFVDDLGGDGVLDGSDRIEFRAERNPGEPGIELNEITDTNAFFLSWSGGEGPAPIAVERDPIMPTSFIDAYDSTLHFEEENFWFGGHTLPSNYDGEERTLHVTERVSHERYYWRSGRGVPENPLHFDCSPAYRTNGSHTVSVRLTGAAFDGRTGTTVRHEVTFFLNGFNIGVVSIRDTADTTVSLRVSSNILVNGRNTLTFAVAQDSQLVHEVFLDYIEVNGSWNPHTEGGPLLLPGTAEQGKGIVVTGYPATGGAEEGEGRFVTQTGDVLRPATVVERGHLLRVTSRDGAETRIGPGFLLEVGDERVAADAPHQLGIMVVEVEPDPSGDRIVREEFFNTTGSLTPFNDAARFVDEARAGNIIVAGLAFGTVQNSKTPAFIEAFRALGSEEVESRDFFIGSWVFAAVKGDPSSAQEEFVANGRGLSRNLFIPDAENGSSTRVTGSIVSDGSGEVVIGQTLSPTTRAHLADRLVPTENRADLIIITHPAFRSDAERLAAHRRSHDGYAVTVVDIHDVYDEFNHGVKDPIAIRRFLQYADTNWTAPAPRYVVLMGDASYDPQQRMPSSIMVDYIPSYGHPSTDNLYIVAFGDSLMTPRQYIGRLPVMNTTDSRTVVDKLIEYDLTPPARWNKKVVFATGGLDIGERDDLRDNAYGLASIVTQQGFLGEATVISRTGTTDDDLRYPNKIDGPRVRAEVNLGALWLDFNGHGATTTLDLEFGYPEDFENGNKYFILATWSCQTGLFSFPEAVLRNERFVTIPGKGTVASFGGTSFSYTNVDNIIRSLVFHKIAERPDIRELGAIFHGSKHEMYAYFDHGSPLSQYGLRARNHMTGLNMLGDPSMKIAVRPTPELAIPAESIVVDGIDTEFPELGDTALTVTAAIWNYGRVLKGAPFDSGVAVDVTLIDPIGRSVMVLDTVRYLSRSDSVTFNVPLGAEPGEYSVIVHVDRPDVVEETWEEDNRAFAGFLLRGSQPIALEPLPFGVVDDPGSVTIRLLNPPTGAGARFTLDTVPTFDSPLATTDAALGAVVERELTTEWTFTVPSEMRGAAHLWWRAIATTGDPVLAERYPLISSFRIAPALDAAVAIGGVDQMGSTRLVDLTNVASGVGPGTRAVPIEVVAIGQSRIGTTPDSPPITGVKKLTVRVGSIDYRNVPPDGLSVIVFPFNDVTPVRDTFFTFYAGATVAQLEDFVATQIAPGERVVVGTNGASLQTFDSGGSERILAVLRSLGSRIADTITVLDIEGSYALIGGKELDPADVVEAWQPALPLRELGELPPFPVTIRDTIDAIPRAGTWSSPVVGPATAWRNARFDLDGRTAVPLTVSVLGVRRDGVRDTIATTTIVPTEPTIDLGAIDAMEYPRVEFAARFTNDTTQRIRDLVVDFDPSPELAIVPSSIRLSADSVMQGDPADVTMTVANLTSFQAARDVPARLTRLGEQGSVVTSRFIPRIEPLDSVSVTLPIETDRLEEHSRYVAEVNPEDRPGEPYTHNNATGPLALKVTGDAIPPMFTIHADDNRLMHGDYVSPTATLEVRVLDNSRLALDSIRSVTLILDNQWITTAEGGVFEPVTTGDVRALFRYTSPTPLADGPHDLLVFVVDASGNGDTSEIITFYVESDLSIRSVANWPNPMQRETTFLYALTGAVPPESGEIAIYTPSGRKIRSIPLAPNDLMIGMNRVEWDGLDDDGDRLANGVYFYKITVTTDGKSTEAIEKIAVLR